MTFQRSSKYWDSIADRVARRALHASSSLPEGDGPDGRGDTFLGPDTGFSTLHPPEVTKPQSKDDWVEGADINEQNHLPKYPRDSYWEGQDWTNHNTQYLAPSVPKDVRR